MNIYKLVIKDLNNTVLFEQEYRGNMNFRLAYSDYMEGRDKNTLYLDQELRQNNLSEEEKVLGPIVKQIYNRINDMHSIGSEFIYELSFTDFYGDQVLIYKFTTLTICSYGERSRIIVDKDRSGLALIGELTLGE